MPDVTLSRREAKDLTRRRLLQAALRILDTEGEAGLSTGGVCRRAGVAQSTFYVHFRNMSELLQALGEEADRRVGPMVRQARRRSGREPHSAERLREAFRIPLEAMCGHPEFFRLGLRARFDRSTPLGESARRRAAETRSRLVEDLVEAGLPADTPEQARRLEMMADGVTALTEAMALGHLEGRYPDLEEAIDVLIAFFSGARAQLLAARDRTSPDAAS
ncbi:TetR/AcrR family transcriptional regulator [Thermomonospora cellulosilytica]|uniref:AcrR family transcriptional regulator n=1 Tax=Thermomonospora cellulosilytica TaxID=1411118 RepID=A0A7W3MTE2_9ACTN|nr:TetR family transcriptional regulator [Thermomonospora cellulosilytica]MBA9001565.1 AcrR family transcriptional regulator [Thermomonospora cellulosilytica]